MPNPLPVLGDLSKPATVLIEKISDAVGGIFKPYQLVRVAKAEAEVGRIEAESRIQITDLQRRAMHRFLEEEAKKQSNIEEITQRALPLLEANSSPQNVQDDWIANFFDKCRIVSDNDMQELWSRILGGEANSPGTFSKRTVNLMGDLDKSDAELFTKLCGFGWLIGRFTALVLDHSHKIYTDSGIDFDSLSNLENLGLIQFDSIAPFARLELPKKVKVYYYDTPLVLTLPKETDNDLEVGQVLLTRAGQQLAPICGSKPVDGFFDYMYEEWAARSFVPKRQTEQGAAPVG